MKILKILFIILTIIWIWISSYLTYSHFDNLSVYCAPVDNLVFWAKQNVVDCNSILTSKYSEIFWIPVSILWIIFYFWNLILFLIYYFKEKIKKISNFKYFNELILFSTFIWLLFSIYFSFLQIFVIKWFCPYCFTSAVITLILFWISLYLKFRK